MPSTLGASPAWGTAVMGDWLHIGSSGGGDSGTKGSSSPFLSSVTEVCLCLYVWFGFPAKRRHPISQHAKTGFGLSLLTWLITAPSLGFPFGPQMTLYLCIGVKAAYLQGTLHLTLWILTFAQTMLCSSPVGSPVSWTWQWPQLLITWCRDLHTIAHCVVKPGCSVKDIDQTHSPKPAMGLQDTAYPEKRSTESLVEGLRSGCRCHSWVLTTLLPDLAKSQGLVLLWGRQGLQCWPIFESWLW